jgi:hypothetical protein
LGWTLRRSRTGIPWRNGGTCRPASSSSPLRVCTGAFYRCTLISGMSNCISAFRWEEKRWEREREGGERKREKKESVCVVCRHCCVPCIVFIPGRVAPHVDQLPQACRCASVQGRPTGTPFFECISLSGDRQTASRDRRQSGLLISCQHWRVARCCRHRHLHLPVVNVLFLSVCVRAGAPIYTR